jgi:hypothetical protein
MGARPAPRRPGHEAQGTADFGPANMTLPLNPNPIYS